MGKCSMKDIEQAAEKGLKAWQAMKQVVYPKTHDLSHLLRRLDDIGTDVARLDHVQLRLTEGQAE